MADFTISIPDSVCPEDMEFTGEIRLMKPGEVGVHPETLAVRSYSLSTAEHYAILRKKPVLKRIVFEIAGAARTHKQGDWYLNARAEAVCCVSFTEKEYLPLIRREEFE